MLKENVLNHFRQSPKGEEPHKMFQVLSILCNKVLEYPGKDTCWETEANVMGALTPLQ